MIGKGMISLGRRIIIIGAGIAGLSAGCYGQMNGYETEIFEMHNMPGGLCTSWKQKGYNIDGCIGSLTGLSNFYMAGQWTGGLGGVPPAAISGRDILKMICKNDKRKFVTCE